MQRYAFALFLAGAATTADAAQITIQSVTGTWQPVSVVATRDGDADITGTGTDTILWGESFPGYSGRSGFSFSGAADQGPFSERTLFDVGVFSHLNRVIYEGEHVDVARLDLSIEASFDGMSRMFQTSYEFSLWETPNLPATCGDGAPNNIPGTVNRNGCGDRVRLLKNDAVTEVFEHNGLTYHFELFGFSTGPVFWTIENRDNPAPLKAQFWVKGQPGEPVDPGPSPVPLPAGIWMMLGGLSGLFGLRRLRR